MPNPSFKLITPLPQALRYAENFLRCLLICHKRNNWFLRIVLHALCSVTLQLLNQQGLINSPSDDMYSLRHFWPSTWYLVPTLVGIIRASFWLTQFAELLALVCPADVITSPNVSYWHRNHNTIKCAFQRPYAVPRKCSRINGSAAR